MLLGIAQADGKLKPFILASIQSGDVASVATAVEGKLKSVGFEVSGKYSPYAGFVILGVTDDALKQAAAKTDFGVFGVAMRVSVYQGRGWQDPSGLQQPDLSGSGLSYGYRSVRHRCQAQESAGRTKSSLVRKRGWKRMIWKAITTSG